MKLVWGYKSCFFGWSFWNCLNRLNFLLDSVTLTLRRLYEVWFSPTNERTSERTNSNEETLFIPQCVCLCLGQSWKPRFKTSECQVKNELIFSWTITQLRVFRALCFETDHPYLPDVYIGLCSWHFPSNPYISPLFAFRFHCALVFQTKQADYIEQYNGKAPAKQQWNNTTSQGAGGGGGQQDEVNKFKVFIYGERRHGCVLSFLYFNLNTVVIDSLKLTFPCDVFVRVSRTGSNAIFVGRKNDRDW